MGENEPIIRGEFIEMNEAFLGQAKRRKDLLINISIKLDSIKLCKDPARPNQQLAEKKDRPFNFSEEMQCRYSEIESDNDELNLIYKRICELV